jgi:hypothetical protein
LSGILSGSEHKQDFKLPEQEEEKEEDLRR